MLSARKQLILANYLREVLCVWATSHPLLSMSRIKDAVHLLLSLGFCLALLRERLTSSASRFATKLALCETTSSAGHVSLAATLREALTDIVY